MNFWCDGCHRAKDGLYIIVLPEEHVETHLFIRDVLFMCEECLKRGIDYAGTRMESVMWYLPLT